MECQEKNLSDGLHCKACDAQIIDHKLDTELCHTCLAEVYTLIQDIEEVNVLAYFMNTETLEYLNSVEEEEVDELPIEHL